MKTINYKIKIVIAIIITFLIALGALCIGRYTVTPSACINYLFTRQTDDPMVEIVMWSVRFPRTIMALLIGAGLSVSGVSLQAMFGNPLVSSHVLGVSYSAGFGAALGILLFSHFQYVEIMAIVFGFVGMGLTYILSKTREGNGTLLLVLSGVIVGSVFEAFTSFTKFVADPESKLPSITYWLMGSLSGASLVDLVRAVPPIAIAIFVLWLFRWRMNAISLSEEEAASLGVNLKRTRLVIIVATTVITAISVSMCGIISFVGLAVPHLTRMIVGNDHKKLLPMSIFVGASYMVIIDTCARSITASEIPLSILTALIGAPIFAVMLRKTGGGWNA